MILYFIRHGEKTSDLCFNPAIRHGDPPLSRTGTAQAESLITYFKKRNIKKIYASQYLRAQQTAGFLSQAFNLPIHIDERLNEIDSGVIETMNDEEIIKKYPDFWSAFWSRTTDYRFPEGETGSEVKERQDALLQDLISKNEESALICHEGYIRLLLCNLLGMPVYHRHRFYCDFCGILEVEYNEKSAVWTIRKFNQTTY